MLAEAGLVTVEGIEGQEAYQLAADGAQVANQMAMSQEDDAQALLDALLDAMGS